MQTEDSLLLDCLSTFSICPAANMDISNNSFDKVDKKICKNVVFEEGELVEFRADCGLCECKELCHTCT